MKSVGTGCKLRQSVGFLRFACGHTRDSDCGGRLHCQRTVCSLDSCTASAADDAGVACCCRRAFQSYSRYDGDY